MFCRFHCILFKLVIQKYLLNHLPSQVNSKVLTGDIADQNSWIKKVESEVSAPMLSIMAAAFRSVYNSTTGLIVIPAAQQDGVVYKYTLVKCEGACMNGLRSMIGI